MLRYALGQHKMNNRIKLGKHTAKGTDASIWGIYIYIYIFICYHTDSKFGGPGNFSKMLGIERFMT